MSHIPYHEHDCECCNYLGSKSYEFNEDKPSAWTMDFYFCTQKNSIIPQPTLIARYGKYGDYISGLKLLEQATKPLLPQHQSDYYSVFTHLIEQSGEADTIMFLAEAGKRAIDYGFLDHDLKLLQKRQLKLV